ncbi:serine/threonine protein kinase [Actinospica robiniae]|uniref:serine/threonine protein kinase n=1 Tax=Actinospica robiniae TaxID=304901 RepID=UPI00040DC1C3|nr:tetratricopeptide repeat protein [Actinospica robiniae]
MAQVRPDPWWGLALARTDLVPPEEDVDPDAPPSESHRYCANPACPAPVGRAGADGSPGRLKGFCPECGDAFDFTQPWTGQVIARRYEVKRVLGAGGQGKTYLVRDRNLDADVVVKSLWRPKDETGRLERNALVGLRHDSIVRILSYEPDEPYELNGPYLVLEYVPGSRLSARPEEPLDVILGHGLQILQALDYLHARGLLHCDVNPSNVMRFAEPTGDGIRDRVRLIDFGAVRTLADTTPVSVYTAPFAPPSSEGVRGPDPEMLRPTRGFDLFCLGRTLQELCREPLRDRVTDPGVDALNRLLLRATDVTVPARRFVTARQFAEQLSGVIRQVVAAPPEGRRVTRPSMLFGSMTESLHGGLGAPRPIAHWVEARLSSPRALQIAQPFSFPRYQDIVAALPMPLEDPDDDPREAERIRSVLAACRAELRRGSADESDDVLRQAALPDWHWLRGWYDGLISLVRQRPQEAAANFGSVRDMLPGELIPLLALGLCAELAGDPVVARLHYQTVSDTAPALGAAGFGLARALLLIGHRGQAVAVADRLAQEFRFEREASIAAIRLLTACPEPPGAEALPPPDEADLRHAEERLGVLDVDERVRTLMEVEIQHARFRAGGETMDLSDRIRETAQHALIERDFVAMVDLANKLRPPIEWRLRGIPPRMGDSGRIKHEN